MEISIFIMAIGTKIKNRDLDNNNGETGIYILGNGLRINDTDWEHIHAYTWNKGNIDYFHG